MRTSLTGKFGLPDTVRLDAIRTVAGSAIGFRYVCEAGLTGFERRQLPPNTPVPANVRYASRLTQDGTQHEVTVRIAPLMVLVPAE